MPRRETLTPPHDTCGSPVCEICVFFWLIESVFDEFDEARYDSWFEPLDRSSEVK